MAATGTNSKTAKSSATQMVIAVAVFWSVLTAVVQAESINMTTTDGIVTGTSVTSSESGRANLNVFLGIPYAKPPVGNLRFKPPEPMEKWIGENKDATKPPNSCWQIMDNTFGNFSGSNMWNPNTKRDEDCLYLNAWIPAISSAKPIIVWIYGGGFWSGTSTLDVYNAQELAARNDAIVISLNYRLGPLGFLYSGTSDSPGNVGLLDQALALKWVKDNAANMGGDPNKITLMGESAGAVSVGYHLMSPETMDLFNYAIMMSGSPEVDWGIQPHDKALKRTRKLAANCNCTSEVTTEIVECLRKVSAEKLSEAQWILGESYFDVPMGPVVDGTFLTKHPSQLLAEGMVKNTSIIAGVVKDEGTFWILYGFLGLLKKEDPIRVSKEQYSQLVKGVLKPFGKSYTQDYVAKATMVEYYDAIPPWERTSYVDAVDDISGDTLFKCPVVNFARNYTDSVGGQVYVYSFEHRVSSSPWPKWLGVAHGYEIELFMGIPWIQEYRSKYTDGERLLSDDIMKRIVAFANTGDPNTDTASWPRYTSQDQKYVVMKEEMSFERKGLRYDACRFWETQVPIIQEQAEELSKEKCGPNRGTILSNFGAMLVTVIALVVANVFDC